MRQRRAIDVQLEVSANGTRVLGATDAGPAPAPELEEPCRGCACCARWLGHLELLHAAIVEHNRRGRAAAAYGFTGPCPDDTGCLVCTAGEQW